MADCSLTHDMTRQTDRCDPCDRCSATFEDAKRVSFFDPRPGYRNCPEPKTFFGIAPGTDKPPLPRALLPLRLPRPIDDRLKNRDAA